MTLFRTLRRPHISPRHHDAPPDARPEESLRVTDNRNFLLAIVLSAIVLLGWNFLSDRYIPKAPVAKPVIASQPANPVAVAPDGTVVPAVGGAGQLRDRGAVLRETPRVAIDTPRLRSVSD